MAANQDDAGTGHYRYHCTQWFTCSCSSKMVEEFSDISKADKLLMKLWNTHTLKNRYIITEMLVYGEGGGVKTNYMIFLIC